MMIQKEPELAYGGPGRVRRRRGLLLTARLGTALIALFASSLLIVTASRGAFSDTTDNASNNWAAGTVVISDDDTAAMFNASNMAPGDQVVNCIAVTYSGSLVPADVRLYGSAAGTGLDAYLDMTIEIGSGGGFGNCTGFTASSTLFNGTLAGFAAANTNFASGLGSWSPAANPESRTYRFTLTVQDDNGAQGLNASATFTWEAQNQ